MTRALTLDEARDALEKASRALASEFRDFARVPGPSGKIAGGMAVRAIVDIARAVYREEAAKTWRTSESEVARQEIAALSDGDRTRAEDAQVGDAKVLWKEPPLTCPHITRVLASGEVSAGVAAELEAIKGINSSLRYGTWVLKEQAADLRAQLDEKDRELAALKHDIERHIAIAAEHATEARRSALSQSKEG